MNFYEKIFNSTPEDPMHPQNVTLKSYMPTYYGKESYTTKEDKTYTCSIKIESLIHSKPSASVLDLRIGQTSVYYNINKELIDKYNEKDSKTTLAKLGMRVSGFIIRD